jgi:uncharacterized protein
MKQAHSPLIHFFFDRIVLRFPYLILLLLLAVVGFLGYQARFFRLDASAETLVLENDEDLEYARIISSRYGGNDFLVLTYTPTDDLFANATLTRLRELRDELDAMERVSSVSSILDVPLLASPAVPLKEVASNIRTLESPEVDRDLARIEFGESPLYRSLLVSESLKTTALLVYFHPDRQYRVLLRVRDLMRDLKRRDALQPGQEEELKQVILEFREYRDTLKQQRHADILQIRQIMGKYRGYGDLFLGGVSMIADDMISFIRSDLKIFGVGVFLFLILTLGTIFKRARWILLPLLFCVVSTVCMVGFLGWFGWEVTVISSNFISLQLIITMAVAIHLIVRYRELLATASYPDKHQIILHTILLKFHPCMYATLTTMAGFGSLILCDILPVKTFGWIMIAGLIVSLLVTFLLFPSILILLAPETVTPTRTWRFSFTSILARFTQTHGTLIMSLSVLALILSAIGIGRLNVENSFIDYFKSSTEIYQGMRVIDQELGGTTPLDVTIDFAGVSDPSPRPLPVAVSEPEDDDDFAEFAEFEDAGTDEKYWFTPAKMARIRKVHDYLDGLPETGKVLSLATTLKIAENLNQGQALDNLERAVLFSEAPDELKDIMVRPYASIEHNQARVSVRVRDSDKRLRRNELLKRIQRELTGKLGFEPEQVRVAGMLVLYNNMLQSLFSSQIRTLGLTVLALMTMFLVLFRSLKIALIALFPNVLSVSMVLGIMGWLKIPLDMMTITIAAISVGIAVDDTIHYIHRFKQEFEMDRSYIRSLHRCHGSIGHAMHYTSVTVIMGFSILALSNFIPSIYFGLLTSLAMFIALIAALTLLPQMLIMVKPFGREHETTE